jgi:hypothetical protein
MDVFVWEIRCGISFLHVNFMCIYVCKEKRGKIGKEI